MCAKTMFTFAIILALVAVVTSAKGTRRQRQNDIVKPRTVNSDNKCKAVRQSCQPRNTYVEIQSNDLSKFVYQVVQVKRCSGICIGYKRCLPTKIVNTVMSIKARRKCETITVEEHLACKCECKKKAKDCPWPYFYRKDRCDCGCSPEFIKKCSEQSNKTANIKNCTCECNNKRECTTGTTWSSEECRCKLQQ